ncbi:DUF6316 family protein [Marinibactrum halimedae]|uniref:DUF6316 domain-containing protein n=1 Tax=Marinibactrum halimedae TaxID=1444977 RepID=A0AA37WN16_9GAMM|nr:DUF6316 family protein [Marinibactrum halimedae]MCD9459317.1 DUF6316 family protein [Marinibactrum halimedae]GLS25791.1 hypothetical protein GCM10007877_15050 [Marinibactrum halimedae]
MQYNRNGELGHVPSRSDRIFQQQNYFYYHTREGIDIGPFDSEEDAKKGICEFIEFMQASPDMSATLSHYSGKVA